MHFNSLIASVAVIASISSALPISQTNGPPVTNIALATRCSCIVPNNVCGRAGGILSTPLENTCGGPNLECCFPQEATPIEKPGQALCDALYSVAPKTGAINSLTESLSYFFCHTNSSCATNGDCTGSIQNPKAPILGTRVLCPVGLFSYSIPYVTAFNECIEPRLYMPKFTMERPAPGETLYQDKAFWLFWQAEGLYDWDHKLEAKLVRLDSKHVQPNASAEYPVKLLDYREGTSLVVGRALLQVPSNVKCGKYHLLVSGVSFGPVLQRVKVVASDVQVEVFGFPKEVKGKQEIKFNWVASGRLFEPKTPSFTFALESAPTVGRSFSLTAGFATCFYGQECTFVVGEFAQSAVYNLTLTLDGNFEQPIVVLTDINLKSLYE